MTSQSKKTKQKHACIDINSTGARSYTFTPPGICQKRREDTLFAAQSESRIPAPPSPQKRPSPRSYHNTNANIAVFRRLTGLQRNNTRFHIPSGLDNFLSYSPPAYTDLIILIEIKKSKCNFKK